MTKRVLAEEHLATNEECRRAENAVIGLFYQGLLDGTRQRFHDPVQTPVRAR
jgi:hypothetical protein